MSVSIDAESKTIVAPTLCGACEEKFECGAKAACESASKSCWCSEVQLTAAAQADLKSLYQGCLCKTCLTKWANPAAE